MDLTYPDEAKSFADEVRGFIRENLPQHIRDKVMNSRELERDDHVAWQRILHARGWATPSWPQEFGGPGWTTLQRHMFAEILSEEGAPAFIPFGQEMLAPVLFAAGSREQKQHFLPRIANLDYWFCQGFSEPGAGSDLASLKCRAVLEGEQWVINGQKMWTSTAQNATHIFLLARTDAAAPKPQMGISMFIFPLAVPGITVRPIITMDGEHHTNEVFFEDVRIPRDAIIGEPNKGWDYAKLLLGHERTTIARVGQSKRQLKRLKTIAREEMVDGVPLIETPSFRAKVAELEIELTALDLSVLRMIAGEGKNAPGNEANMVKIKGSEIQQRVTELLVEAVGPAALPYDRAAMHGAGSDDPIGPDYAGTLAASYFMTRVVTIYGGSNEIQRNILAKSLGL
jgi:alkylation response protein AidB-like acyl-CoA dehydrogenase